MDDLSRASVVAELARIQADLIRRYADLQRTMSEARTALTIAADLGIDPNTTFDVRDGDSLMTPAKLAVMLKNLEVEAERMLQTIDQIAAQLELEPGAQQ